ncbi:MAG: PadR family transcriptional regulator, regulatory protein PadR [Actinomycetota bacterium]|nr:PadR family transcriptional regulator, regulatory protein PadR [Actinomycetota bacterium]
MAHAWKACWVQALGGSNPPFSAFEMAGGGAREAGSSPAISCLATEHENPAGGAPSSSPRRDRACEAASRRLDGESNPPFSAFSGHDPRSGACRSYLYIARFSRMEPLSRTTAATIDVLRVLAESPDPSWGLLVIKSSGRPAGTVYPILERLESLGWVTSSWDSDDSRSGPRRRYYELTEEGGAAASSAIEEFAARSRVATPARNIAARAVTA